MIIQSLSMFKNRKHKLVVLVGSSQNERLGQFAQKPGSYKSEFVNKNLGYGKEVQVVWIGVGGLKFGNFLKIDEKTGGYTHYAYDGLVHRIAALAPDDRPRPPGD